MIAFKGKIQRLGQWTIIANLQVLCLEDKAPWCTSWFKIKGRLWFLTLQFDNIHLIQFLLTGHGHISCCNTRFVSSHEVLEIGNLFLLTFIGRLQLRFLHGIDFLELVVVTRVTRQLLILHMIDDIDNIVQEWNIVRNKDKGILIVLEIALEPVNMLSIQVVGRLVQKQDIRLFKEEFSQKHLGSLST
ncbi:hypothetical protein SMIDD26_00516 [Streptococcus mitis]|uniref:Uncharacterized protein n=1 Tax=Streptococcus mitis TaxID=28037 RepID=A0A139PX42_STRMT|nr:hypothetical protein SMIDD26_00516 [Streptococcus mitis]